MTRILVSIFVLLVVSTGTTQNFAVRLGAVEDSPITSWPVQINPIGTNTVVAPPFILMTQAALENCIATNQPAYNAWESNKTYLAKAKTDAALAEFIAKMDKIETWIDKTQGTNSLNNAQRDNAINDLCQAFKKLRKALSTIYKPEDDQTQ